MKILITEQQYDFLKHGGPLMSNEVDYVNRGTNDRQLTTGGYYMMARRITSGWFGIRILGDVQLDPVHYFELEERPVFKNSAFFSGGFVVDHHNHKIGIGREIIRKLFLHNPNLENIFLYALEYQGAIPFWKKIGGEVILEKESGLVYIQLKRQSVLSK